MQTTYEQLRRAFLARNLQSADLAKQMIGLTPAERTLLEKLIATHATEQAVINEIPEFCVGDLVRSNDQHWQRTGDHLTGSIIRFEKVPDSQIDVVGSRHWAYLNSGTGPVAISVLEKVRTEEQSLENLRTALEPSQKVEITHEVQPGIAIFEFSKA
jgi:hypothetical protein